MEKVNGKSKIHRWGAVLGIIIFGVVLWFLCREQGDINGSREHVENGFREIAQHQHDAERDIAAIRRGLADSKESTDRIEHGIGESARAADRIREANQTVTGATERIETGLDNLTERNRSTAEQLAGAERRNTAATNALDNAAKAIRECRERNRESEQIFARYIDAVQGK